MKIKYLLSLAFLLMGCSNNKPTPSIDESNVSSLSNEGAQKEKKAQFNGSFETLLTEYDGDIEKTLFEEYETFVNIDAANSITLHLFGEYDNPSFECKYKINYQDVCNDYLFDVEENGEGYDITLKCKSPGVSSRYFTCFSLNDGGKNYFVGFAFGATVADEGCLSDLILNENEIKEMHMSKLSGVVGPEPSALIEETKDDHETKSLFASVFSEVKILNRGIEFFDPGVNPYTFDITTIGEKTITFRTDGNSVVEYNDKYYTVFFSGLYSFTSVWSF